MGSDIIVKNLENLQIITLNKGLMIKNYKQKQSTLLMSCRSSKKPDSMLVSQLAFY